MSNAVQSEELLDSQAQISKPLDEAVWRAWLKKNLLEERQRAGARIKAVNWVCIGVLLIGIVVSSYISTSYVSIYQTVIRIAIGLGAIVMLIESLRARQYVSVALFAGMVLLFNPLFPYFALSENWPILLASMLPFAASLAWIRECAHRAADRAPELY